MQQIDKKILVLSGKGGVGKSTVAANLAVWLSLQDKKVGLLDVDIHGPSIPKLLGLEAVSITASDNRIIPVEYGDSLKVISIGFLLAGQNDAVIWRGPMKHNIINQFIKDVDWGKLDYLVVDCPPGTGDEPLSVVQVLGETSVAVVVTTPQQLATVDVRKCITFCKQLNVPILGIVENMSGFVCPHCNQKVEILKGSGGKDLSDDFNVPFLGSIPMDIDMAAAGDAGRPLAHLRTGCPAAEALVAIFGKILNSKKIKIEKQETKRIMRVAIPLHQDKLSEHFGHCEQFMIIDVDDESKQIKGSETVAPPAHEPGVLPQWLAGMQVQLIIAGGMGNRAQQLFANSNIEVLCGAPQTEPEQLVQDYLAGKLVFGQNICDH